MHLLRMTIFLAVVLGANPLSAGSLTFSVTDATDGTLSKTYTQFSDANITNWIAAYQSGCNASINGTCTRGQVLAYIIQASVNQWVSNVNAYNQAQALAQAPAPTTITIQP